MIQSRDIQSWMEFLYTIYSEHRFNFIHRVNICATEHLTYENYIQAFLYPLQPIKHIDWLIVKLLIGRAIE